MKLLLAVLASSLSLAGCVKSINARQVVLPSEKALCLTLSDARTLGFPNSNATTEQWSKGGTSGASELEYHAEPSGTGASPSIHEKLSQQTTSKNAVLVVQGERLSMNSILKAQKLAQTPMPGQIRYGDESNLTILSRGKTPVGNIFTARQGNRVFTLSVVGVCFQTPKKWDAFAGRKVRAWLSGKATLAPETWTYN